MHSRLPPATTDLLREIIDVSINVVLGCECYPNSSHSLTVQPRLLPAVSTTIRGWEYPNFKHLKSSCNGSLLLYGAMSRLISLITCVICLCSIAWGQFETSSVLGTVKDSSEAVLGGARVTLTNLGTN